MDNHASNALDGDDMKTHYRALRIREEGWRQIPGWPTDVEGFRSWPAEGQTSVVSLTANQWEFIAAALDDSAETSDQLAALPHFAESREEWEADAAESRRLAGELRRKLAD